MTEPSMIRPIIHHLSPLILSFTVRWYHGASDNAPEGLSMKLLLGLSCLLTVVLAVCAQAAERPKITGIANIAVKVDNLDEARKFYSGVVGMDEAFPTKDAGIAGDLACFKIRSEENTS